MDNNQNKNNDNSEIKHNNKSDHSTIRRVNISFDDNEVPIKKILISQIIQTKNENQISKTQIIIY